jgi:hypothetical protein
MTYPSGSANSTVSIVVIQYFLAHSYAVNTSGSTSNKSSADQCSHPISSSSQAAQCSSCESHHLLPPHQLRQLASQIAFNTISSAGIVSGKLGFHPIK